LFLYLDFDTDINHDTKIPVLIPCSKITVSYYTASEIHILTISIVLYYFIVAYYDHKIDKHFI